MIESSQKWVVAGYELFSREGPDGINVEKLSRLLGLNKSGFYHHFGDREVFLNKLMEHHKKMGQELNNKILLLEKFYPDFLYLLSEYQTSLFVQVQLHDRMHIPLFRKVFTSVAIKNEKAILPLWSDYIKLSGNRDLAHYLWNILREIVFARMKTEDLTQEKLSLFVKEYADKLDLLRKEDSKKQNSGTPGTII